MDTLGMLLWFGVHEANAHDGSAAITHFLSELDEDPSALKTVYSSLKTLWADKGYRGSFAKKVEELGMKMIIPKAVEAETPFVTKWRWVVERTFGWIGRYRRLSKDYEHLPSSSRTWVIIAIIGLMVRRLRPT